MKKKLMWLAITLIAVFSISIVAYADPTSGIIPIRPWSAPLCPPPACLEDCQGECEDD